MLGKLKELLIAMQIALEAWDLVYEISGGMDNLEKCRELRSRIKIVKKDIKREEMKLGIGYER